MELYFALLMVASLSLAPVCSEKSHNYSGCSSSLSVLEDALYNTGTNKLKLNRYFYPPRQEPVPYAKITFKFEDENGNLSDSEDGKCEVTFVWAIGGFLLIQPPSVFTFTSLFFFHTRQNDFSLDLRLPYLCRPLVQEYEIENGTCTCANKDGGLDLLNQQMKLYAKYSDPKEVKLGTDILTQAECYDMLDSDYWNSIRIRIYLSYVLCFPLIFIIVLIVVVRSLSNSITTKLSNSLNHPNVAGLVLTGIFFHFFFLALDMAALRLMMSDRELQDFPGTDARQRLNSFVTWITFFFDLAITLLIVLPCSIYLHCQDTLKNGKLFNHIFQRIFSPLFYVIFGEFNLTKFWNSVRNGDDKVERHHRAWIVCFMLLAPLFSLTSHAGYILAAWLTEPNKTTSVALVYIGIYLYMFLMLRQCYIANKKSESMDSCNCFLLVLYPIRQCCKYIVDCIYLCCTKKTYCEYKTEYNKLLEEPKRRNETFKTKTLCVTFTWGLPLTGSVAFLVSAFYELPVASYTLPIYLLNVFQVFIVMITLLITYKILQITEPEVHTFLRNMKKGYETHDPKGKAENIPEDEVEATGTLAGALVKVVVGEYCKSHAEQTGGSAHDTSGSGSVPQGGLARADALLQQPQPHLAPDESPHESTSLQGLHSKA